MLDNMIKRLFKKAIFSIFDTPIGKSMVFQYVKTQPSMAIKAVQKSLDLDEVNSSSLPPQLKGFEDLHFLFNPNHSNRLVLRMDFDEAARLFSVAKSIPGCRALEVGRFSGGSAVLLGTALNAVGGRLISVDINDSEDKAIKGFLDRYGLNKVVDLVAADSRVYKVQPESLDLVFIDGDHRYEGVKADFYNLRNALKVGGHLLFHDYFSGEIKPVQFLDKTKEHERGFFSADIGVRRFLDEMQESERDFFALERVVGTLAHFKKTKSTM